MLPLAMQLGEDIYLDAPVSAKLYYNLQNNYIRILSLVIPSLHRINIIPSLLDYGGSYSCDNEVATGFSGGIDSFCTLQDHLSDSMPKSHKVTRLVFNNVGSHGEYNARAAKVLFNERYEILAKYPKELEMDFIKIDSNLSDILQMNFQQTHLSRNVAAVLMLQRLFGRYYYSSAYRYEDCHISEENAPECADPAAVHLLSTETLDVVSTGCQYSQAQKTENILRNEGTMM